MSDIADWLKPGARIWVAGSSNEPTALLAELASADLPENLTFIQFPLAGFNATDFTQIGPGAVMETFFMSPALKNAAPGRLKFLPMQMRAVFDYLTQNVDVVMIMAARDAHGVLRLGPNVDFAAAALSSAGVVLAEINDGITAPAGGLAIDEARIDFSVRVNRPLAQMAPPVIDEAAAAIGANVAGLIRDGDCLQTGIGSIPAAILQELSGLNDLGMHGGLIDDGGMALIEAGNLNGSVKAVDKGVHVTGMALGSTGLYDWLGHTPSVQFRGADYTHDVSVIRQLENFVSINSAVEVDLYGQVNAEFAAGRQLSGTGGSVDFMRAARRSAGGRSIVAMNATARGGSVSRIVPKVELVTALRTDVDLVVTEFGVAKLDGVDVRERVLRLIEIAAPAFRDELLDLAPV